MRVKCDTIIPEMNRLPSELLNTMCDHLEYDTVRNLHQIYPRSYFVQDLLSQHLYLDKHTLEQGTDPRIKKHIKGMSEDIHIDAPYVTFALNSKEKIYYDFIFTPTLRTLTVQQLHLAFHAIFILPSSLRRLQIVDNNWIVEKKDIDSDERSIPDRWTKEGTALMFYRTPGFHLGEGITFPRLPIDLKLKRCRITINVPEVVKLALDTLSAFSFVEIEGLLWTVRDEDSADLSEGRNVFQQGLIPALRRKFPSSTLCEVSDGWFFYRRPWQA